MYALGVENGVVNLIAIVSFLIVSIGIIPVVLILGSGKSGGPSSGSTKAGLRKSVLGDPALSNQD